VRLTSLLRDSIFVRALLVLWIISTALEAYLLTNIDKIVHADLYNYGLQFSPDWAIPYWMTLRFIFVFLAIPSILSAAALITSIFGKGEERKPVERVDISQRVGITQKFKPQPTQSPQPQPPQQPQQPTQPTVAQRDPQQAMRENHMLISCPKCKRVFGKPLVMLDFSTGNSRLVNVCPYCNQILGKADDKQVPCEDVGVIDLNKREVEQK
jgi:uncharacterized Zn-finger protein